MCYVLRHHFKIRKSTKRRLHQAHVDSSASLKCRAGRRGVKAVVEDPEALWCKSHGLTGEILEGRVGSRWWNHWRRWDEGEHGGPLGSCGGIGDAARVREDGSRAWERQTEAESTGLGGWLASP